MNHLCWLLSATWLLMLGTAAQGQTLLYKWNFDNAITTGGTNITVAPAAIDSADGYTGGILTNSFNALGLQSIPSASGVYGTANSTDRGLVNTATNGQVGTQPASGALTGGSGNLSAITNQFTVTMWFNLSAFYTNNGNARLFCIDGHTANNGVGGTGADGNELYIDLAAGPQAIQLGVNNPGQSGSGGTGPTSVGLVLTNTTSLSGLTNIWFFIACVYTNNGTGSVGIYVGRTNATAVLVTTLNGVGVLASTNAWNNLTNLILIGNRTTDAKRNLPGTIDDVRLYKEALSQAQVQAAQGVITAPTITAQPMPDVVFPGTSPQFKVTASGSVPLAYQWQRNGTNLIDGGNISGSLSPTLAISNVSAADVFNNYQVIITNSVGSVTSTQVSLSLTSTNGSYEAAILTNSPFAFYTFSETGDPSSGTLEAYDSMGVFNGTYGPGALNGFDSIAGPQSTADGLIGFPDTNTALFATYQNFPVNSYATVPPFNLNNGAGTNVLTITAWIKPAGPQVHGVGIVFSRSGTTTAGLDYNATNSDGNLKLGYTWNNEANTFNWDSGLVATPGIWSLVSLVITPTNSTIYVVNVGGLQFSTIIHTNVVQRFEGSTLIGNDILDTTGKRNFNGSIDEVVFFNQALTVTNISYLYAAASGTLFAPQPPSISVQPTWPSPVYVGQPASSTVTSIGGTSFQWKAGSNPSGPFTNLTDGANISGSAAATLTINSVQASNALSYIVVITNAFGAVTSSPAATLTVTPSGPPQTYTLDLGGTPIVEAAGSDWNTANNWNPDGVGASTSAFSNPGSTYTIVAGSRLRTPVLANVVFPGTTSTLKINGDGALEGSGTNPVTIGELRIKHTGFNPATNYYSHLALNGGEIFNGDTGLIALQGWLDVQANSVIYNDAVDTRSFRIDSWLTGSGSIYYFDGNQTNGAVDMNVTGTTNTFNGQWLIPQGGLLGSSTNSLGTNNITVGASGSNAVVETSYDLNDTTATLTLGTNGKVYLHQNNHFASVIINGTPLANGTYTFAQLNAAYPVNFPATWPAQTGSTVTTGSGQIVVGNGPASMPRIATIGVNGTTLSLSVTNGVSNGSWTLLQSTNLILPLSQWQTNLTGNFDGSGNLSTNIANTATNNQEFYILKQ